MSSKNTLISIERLRFLNINKNASGKNINTLIFHKAILWLVKNTNTTKPIPKKLWDTSHKFIITGVSGFINKPMILPLKLSKNG